ncbi:MAG: germination protein YpeB, partial [Clostridia bacterium]|nr:germination protein YpeB [Clostridia bacterium]
MKKDNEAFIKAESLSGGGKKENAPEKNAEPTASETNKILKEEKKAIKEKERGSNGKDAGKLKRFKVACAVLAVSVAALTGGLLYKSLSVTESDVMLDASYKRSLYDASEQVGSIDLNLSKALATKDSAALSGYLLDAAIESELAESDIHDLPIKDENKVYTTKLINQIGDFTKMLNKKIARGESVTAEEYETLDKLREYNRKLKDALDEFISSAGENYEFNINADGNDALLSGLNQLENLSVEYPELIYDGPFSDGLLKREIKGLKGDNITSSEAKDAFLKLFAEYSPENIEVGKSVNADIPCFNVSA